jgi:hypothetical protein
MRKVPGLEGREIEVKILYSCRALAMVPAICEQYSANIEENHVEGEHRRLSVCVSAMKAR